MSHDTLRAAVTGAVRDLAAERGADAAAIHGGTVLFGAPGALFDSLGLVTLVAEVEARVADATGRDVILADERAMSRSRSPFRTVDTLVEHTAAVLAGES